jgi:hypothetical protein
MNPFMQWLADMPMWAKDVIGCFLVLVEIAAVIFSFWWMIQGDERKIRILKSLLFRSKT